MLDFKEIWKARILSALNKLVPESNKIDEETVIAEIPPKAEMGDLGFPMFGFAKTLKKSPQVIAKEVAEILIKENFPDEIITEGPFVNIRFNRGAFAENLLNKIFSTKDCYGRVDTLKGSRIMVEFSSPNTNKPLHLGHLRNDVLGESISRILKACGADVRKVSIINDRGLHICKSMLVYQKYGEGKTPQSESIKSDHFVGDWYVRFGKELQNQVEEIMQRDGIKKEEAEERAPFLIEARELLRKWEAGDSETVNLWRKMNDWAMTGMKETYDRTGVSFDQFYFESETYLKGRDEVLKGLDTGLFYKAEDGAVWIDLTEEKLDKKVLLRSDGTSLYITQDIGTAIFRYRDWKFNRLVYVVGSEQEYHFKVLFTILKKLGFEWAQNLYHLSYGMVNLPEGKMKTREGTVVDADDLLDNLKNLAFKEIKEKEREEAVGDPDLTAEKIALGALHYYLLQVSPTRDMLFNPQESLSFKGNTGPYLQYMGARISSILRKNSVPADMYDCKLLTSDPEWELLKALADYPNIVGLSAEKMEPSILAVYLYDLSKAFSRFYHDCPILNAESVELVSARIRLAKGAIYVLKDALDLLCIPFLETM